MIQSTVKALFNQSRRYSYPHNSPKRYQSKWYKDGLNFKCTGCGMFSPIDILIFVTNMLFYKGKCCTGQSGWIWITEADAQNISETLKITQDEFYTKYTRKIPSRKGFTLIEKQGKTGFDCIFLEDQKFCKIYNVRPNQCRL